MKVKTILSIIALGCIFSAANVSAGESIGGYVSGHLGRSFLSDSSYKGAVSSGEINFDDGFIFMGAGGYDWGMWRLEGELSFAVNDVDDYTDGTIIYDGGDRGMDVWTLMVNGYYEYENNSKFTPFVYLGLGFSYVNGFNVDTVAETITDSSDTVWGWQFGLGCDYYFTDTLSMSLGYRYMQTDDISFDTAGEMEHAGHRGLLGMKILF